MPTSAHVSTSPPPGRPAWTHLAQWALTVLFVVLVPFTAQAQRVELDVLEPEAAFPFLTPTLDRSPMWLTDVSEATEVRATAFVSPVDTVWGSYFAARSRSGLRYDYTRALAERFNGGRILGWSTLPVGNLTLPVAHLQGVAGAYHAVSLELYHDDDWAMLDAAHTVDGFLQRPDSTSEVLTIQLWSPSRTTLANMASAVLAEAQALRPQFGLLFDTSPPTPSVWVQRGVYERATVVLEVGQRAERDTVIVKGWIARTQRQLERGTREAFEQPLFLNSSDPNGMYRTLQTGYVYDAALRIEAKDGTVLDRFYVAEPRWQHAFGRATISRFETYEEIRTPSADERQIERGAQITGEVVDWVSLYRPFRFNGYNVDLSDYNTLHFSAQGRGVMHVRIEQEQVPPSDSYQYEIVLRPTATRYTIPYGAFQRPSGPVGFDGRVARQLVFFVEGNTESPTSFDLIVSEVAFTQALAVSQEAETPRDALDLAANYPNPFRQRTALRFTLPEPSAVRLTVYDLLGREVERLADGWHAAGAHQYTWAPDALPAGLYVYRLEAGETTRSRTLTLLK
ncbi:MAG: T9SS type A sorting domain-containing protein [Bacteroidota bacterium]